METTEFTRSDQRPDVIYVVDNDWSDTFVSPDGYGRIYYTDADAARAEHGDLPVVVIHGRVVDW